MKYSDFINCYEFIAVVNVFPEKPISSKYAQVFWFLILQKKENPFKLFYFF